MTRSNLAAQASPSAKQVLGDVTFQTLSRLMQDKTGIVLSDAKRGLIISRLSRRLKALGLSDFDAYRAVLEGPEGEAELQEMILLLTTNVTRFFREPHHFETLRTDVLPHLISRAKAGGRVRIWSAGCSSGEEAYSAAMTILGLCAEAPEFDIQILATDIDSNMLKTGEAARYKLSDEDLSKYQVLSRFMSAVPDSPHVFEVSQKARSLVRFGQLNLLDPWPMRGTFDIVFCRNVVIYFSTQTQQALWPRFTNILAKGGHLMIGHSERVTGSATAALRSVGVTHYALKASGE